MTLGEIAAIEMGQSPNGNSYNALGKGMPLINGPTEFTDHNPVPVQWTTKPTKICKNGDLLLCVRGSSVGRINIADDEFCIGRGVAAIRASDKNIYQLFLIELIKYEVEKVVRLSSGSTFPNIDKATLTSCKVKIPSLVEQQKIAAILRTWDDAIDKIEKLISACQKQKNLIRNKMLRPFAGWQKKTLRETCVLHYGKSISRDHYAEDGDTYVYGTSGQIGKTKLNPQFLGPSIIIGRKGTINYPILIEPGEKFRVIDTAYFLETKENVTFLFYLIDALNLLKLNEASGVPSLSRESLYNIKITLPFISEQKKIAEVLVTVDKGIDCLKKKKIVIQSQKRGLMQKLLTGQWQVQKRRQCNVCS